MDRIYACIDLKSFYASVECVARGLDPLRTNLVVADKSRTDKTICLAVSPSLKAYGISGRARLFEVVQKVREVNYKRQKGNNGNPLTEGEYDDPMIQSNPGKALDYIVAPPRMGEYMRVSAQIYDVYLKYIAPEHIHPYSIDEVFMDVTDYLSLYRMTARELVMKMIRDVLRETKITATAGIGSNLYLGKIAMDIVAKKMPPDKDGVRIAELNEMSYRELLWEHLPLTDFWRIGKGYTSKLNHYGIYTMGDIAKCSVHNEDLLYKLFGINAELLIDHAWGWEPCTMADIKAYRPETNCISSGQVLQSPYDVEKGKLIVREMADLMVLDLVKKGLITDQIVLTVGYDIENMKDESVRAAYHGEIAKDYYGRMAPKHAHGTVSLPRKTSSSKIIIDAVMKLYDDIVNPILWIRRVNITANHVVSEKEANFETTEDQIDLFADQHAAEKERIELEKERNRQKAIIKIQSKYGKNAILRGMNYEEGATTRERNGLIGGHKE